MKKIIFVVVFFLVPVLVIAQASGGQIRRKPQTSSSSKPSRTQNRRRAEPHRQLTVEQKSILDNIANNMVYIEGGTFMMGPIADEKWKPWDQEGQLHRVNLSSFYISKYEVTQEIWETVMENNPSTFYGVKRPVENVNWEDCQVFIKKLNALTGRKYRLPYEAEWEFAARGGNRSMGYKYSGSNNINDVAWYKGNSSNMTHEVGLKKPNELGLYDMTGNVLEFCQDYYMEYDGNAQTNPTGPKSGFFRVYRGGGWRSSIEYRYCHISARQPIEPSTAYNYVGLRLALSY